MTRLSAWIVIHGIPLEKLVRGDVFFFRFFFHGRGIEIYGVSMMVEGIILYPFGANLCVFCLLFQVRIESPGSRGDVGQSLW